MVAAGSAASRETRDREVLQAGETGAPDTRGKAIIEEIEKLRDSYGRKGKRDARSIPFSEAEKLFEKVAKWARDARVTDASRRMEEAAEKLERAAAKVEGTARGRAPMNASYAQVARQGGTEGMDGRLSLVGVTPTMTPREEKSIIVHIANKEQAKRVGEQSRGDIAERIERGMGERGKGRVTAVTKLRSGDLAIHVCNTSVKQEMETTQEWVKSIAPEAVVRIRTWPVMISGVRVEDHPLNAWEAQARSIEKENVRLHPSLKICGLRWLGNVVGKRDYATMIAEIAGVEQANRLISEGVAMGRDLKVVGVYNSRNRVTQCFNCQRYGHTSTRCRVEQRCGHCGGKHRTNDCEEGARGAQKECAACEGGNHPSWSTACPARIREIARAKTAQRAQPSRYPEPAAAATAFAFGSQVDSARNAGEEQWTLIGGKRRRIGQAGRPIGAVNKAKNFGDGANEGSILQFACINTPVRSQGNAGEAQAESQELLPEEANDEMQE
jgi:hypothetical protein